MALMTNMRTLESCLLVFSLQITIQPYTWPKDKTPEKVIPITYSINNSSKCRQHECKKHLLVVMAGVVGGVVAVTGLMQN